KIAGSAKLIHQFAALRAVILIVYIGGNAIDVQRQREAEKHQHQDGKRKRQRQTAHVAHDMKHFLTGDALEPPQIHAARLSSCSIMATKTSSMEGSMGSRTPIEIPAFSKAARILGVAAPTSSTVT